MLKLNTRGFFEAASDLFSLLMLISSEYLVWLLGQCWQLSVSTADFMKGRPVQLLPYSPLSKLSCSVADGRIYSKGEMPIKCKTQPFSSIFFVCHLQSTEIVFFCGFFFFSFIPERVCFIIKKYKQTIKPQTQIESYVRANAAVIIKWVGSYNKICFFVMKVLTGVLCARICWFLLRVFFPLYYSNIQCFILSCQGNLGSVGVSLHFGVCWF